MCVCGFLQSHPTPLFRKSAPKTLLCEKIIHRYSFDAPHNKNDTFQGSRAFPRTSRTLQFRRGHNGRPHTSSPAPASKPWTFPSCSDSTPCAISFFSRCSQLPGFIFFRRHYPSSLARDFPSALAWRARNREAPPFSSSITASHHVIKRSAHPFCVGPKLWPHFYFCLPSSARTVAKKKHGWPATFPRPFHAHSLRSLRFSCFFPSSSLLVSIIVVENGQI